MNIPALLENVMVIIRMHTTTYQGTVNALRRNKKEEINSKLVELNLIINDGDNDDEIGFIEAELIYLTYRSKDASIKTLNFSMIAKLPRIFLDSNQGK